MRKNGLSKGKTDVYIKSPGGKLFRSKKELEVYIRNKNLTIKIEDFNFTIKKDNSKNSSFSNLNESSSKDSIETNLTKNIATMISEESQSEYSFTTLDHNSTTEAETQTEHTLMTNTAITNELLGRNWLSDLTIQPYLQAVNDRLLSSKSCTIINPLIVHGVKNLEDFKFFFEQLDICSKGFIILPVNDSKNLNEESGTHWSCLLYEKSVNTFYHFDSCGDYNLPSAKIIADKLISHLGKDYSGAIVTSVNSPQQTNNYDCGPIMCWIIESLVHDIITNNAVNLEFIKKTTLTDTELIKKRSLMAYFLLNTSPLSNGVLYSFIEKPGKHPLCIESRKKNLSKGNIIKNNNPWTKVKPNVPKGLKQHSFHSGITTQNRFEVLQENLVDQHTDFIDKSIDFKRPETYQKQKKINEQNSQLKNNMFQQKNNIRNKSMSSCPNLKITLCSDSQGRDVARRVESLTSGRMKTFGYVRSNTTLIQVIDSIVIEEKTPVVVIGGTNNSLTDTIDDIYDRLEQKLKCMSKERPIFVSTIPTRYDVPLNHPTNIKLNTVNNYIYELTARIDNVYIIDLNNLQRFHYTNHGLHLNNRGKTKLAYSIINAVTSWFSSPHKNHSLQFHTKTVSSVQPDVNQSSPQTSHGSTSPITLVTDDCSSAYLRCSQSSPVMSDEEDPHLSNVMCNEGSATDIGKPDHQNSSTSILSHNDMSSNVNIDNTFLGLNQILT